MTKVSVRFGLNNKFQTPYRDCESEREREIERVSGEQVKASERESESKRE